LNLVILAGYALMGSHLTIDNKVFHPSPFFPDAFGSNHDRCRHGFDAALNTDDPFANANTANAGIFFDIPMTAAGDKSDLRTIPPKNSRFLFKPQFRPVRLEDFGST
jgi:hypothetical protein